MTLSDKIARCAQHKQTRLDLNGLGLTGEETELTQLASCTHLISLDVSKNNLKNLAFLQGLVHLEELNLSANKAVLPHEYWGYENVVRGTLASKEYAVLQDLPALKWLNVSDTFLRSLIFLNGLEKLEWLDVSANQEVTGYNHIVEVETIEPTLKATEYLILAHLPALKYLDVSCNFLKPTSFVFLEGLPQLEHLCIRSCIIKNMQYLQGCTKLTYLDASYSSIDDIQNLQNCKNLTYLSLLNNNLQDITPLQDLQELTCLNLYNNSIENIEPLASLQKLEQLNIGLNKYKDITPLLKMPALRYLSLSSYSIDDFSPIFQLSQLELLDVQQTRLKDFSFLETFDKLKFLIVAWDFKEIPHQLREKLGRQGGRLLVYIGGRYEPHLFEEGAEKYVAHISIVRYLSSLRSYRFNDATHNTPPLNNALVR
jgi:internalin A